VVSKGNRLMKFVYIAVNLYSSDSRIWESLEVYDTQQKALDSLESNKKNIDLISSKLSIKKVQ
jgi:hypothetical protein